MTSETTPILSSKKVQNKALNDSDKPSIDIEIKTCVIAILIYLAAAVLFYTFIFQKKWSFIDSLYFAVVTMTTVGYGDLCPDTIPSKLFTCFFALGGVTFIGIALGVIVANVIEKDQQALEKEDRLNRFSLLSYEKCSNVKNNCSQQEIPSLLYQLYQFFLLRLPILIALYLGACIIGYFWEEWNPIEILYYFIVTSTTIGYGDLTPGAEYERVYAIFFILVSVGAMGYIIGEVGNLILERRRQLYYIYLKGRPLRLENILEMDADGDEEVSLLEYIEFMLKAMEKVDDELLQDIKEQFNKLDKTGDGCISRADLKDTYKKTTFNNVTYGASTDEVA